MIKVKSELREWATIVVRKTKGGRARVLNTSQRGLFQEGDLYFNHRLYHFPDNAKLNLTIRYSPKGRRMVQEIRVKGGNQ